MTEATALQPLGSFYVSELPPERWTASAVAQGIEASGLLYKLQSQSRVFLKPNLTWPSHLPGVTTSPECLKAVVEAFLEYGARVVIGESNGGYHTFEAEAAFKGHGLYELVKKTGVSIVNLSNVPTKTVTSEVNGKAFDLELPRFLLEEDQLFLTVPVPKVHAMTRVSLAFKNQWGCIPSNMRLRHHPDFSERVVAINRELRVAGVIFDGEYFLDRNGPLKGEPIFKNLILVSDHVGVGSHAVCRIMDIDPFAIRHHRVAFREGMFPLSSSQYSVNTDLDAFQTHSFSLERTAVNWGAAAAFRSKVGTRLVYDSPLADPLHKVLDVVKKNRILSKVFYKSWVPLDHPEGRDEEAYIKEIEEA